MRNWFSAARVACALLVAASLGLFLAGCQKDIPQDGKNLISLAATAAQERATAFDAIKAQITAANPADADSVAKFVADHSTGLHKQADAFAQTVKALNDGSGLGDALRAQIKAASDTARARLENFQSIRKYISAPPEVLTFLDTHVVTLQQQAETIQQIAATLNALESPQQ